MKGNLSLENAVQSLIPKDTPHAPFKIIHDYHFGGYAKHPETLINFIEESLTLYDLPLDIVYTGKLLYAIKDLVQKNFFAKGSKLLMIHSGGLQGNASLGENVL